DRVDRQFRKLFRESFHGLAQELARNVDRHIGRWINRREKKRGLCGGSRTELDDDATGSCQPRDIRGVCGKDRALHASEVVLGKVRDRLEKLRAAPSVEPPSRN